MAPKDEGRQQALQTQNTIKSWTKKYCKNNFTVNWGMFNVEIACFMTSSGHDVAPVKPTSQTKIFNKNYARFSNNFPK